MSKDLFPRVPFDGTWEVTGFTSIAVPDKPISVSALDPDHFDARYFPVGTRIRLAASDDASDAHPEWRSMEITFLPPLSPQLCQHAEALRLGCRDGHLPDQPVSWDAWLQTDLFDKADAAMRFYQQLGVRRNDPLFAIVRQDKMFAWSSVFFKDKDTLVVEVGYFPGGAADKKKAPTKFEVVGMMLKRCL